MLKNLIMEKGAFRLGRPFWTAVCGATVLILALLLGSPERLAMSERLDPTRHAELLISQGDYGEALRLLSSLGTEGLDPWSVNRILLQRAICQKFLGRSGEALAGFQALDGKIEHIQDYLTFWQAECLEGLGRSGSAAKLYRRVAALQPASRLKEWAVLRAADLHLARKRASDAIPLYRQLLGISHEEVRALVGLASGLETTGDSTEARKTRLRLVRDYPETPEALEALRQMEPLKQTRERFYGGIAYREHKMLRQAATLFSEIANASSEHHWRGRAHYELGLVQFDRRQYRSAERSFEKAFRVYAVPKALFELGRCAVKTGRDTRGVEQFEAYARLYPNLGGAAEALWNSAMAYERRRKHREARKLFLKLAARYPRSSFADKGRWRAGFALFQVKEYEEAARAFLGLAKNTEESYLRDQGFYWAAKCYHRIGKKEEAALRMEQAAEGFPTSYYSARARKALGLDSEVYPTVPEWSPAVEQEGDPSSPYLTKGDILAALGLYRLAQREYARAERAHSGDRFALNHLLQRYERVGAMNLALGISSRILNLEQEEGVPMTLASFRRLYPTYYWGEISHAAQQLDVDPNLILAIIRQESAFNEKALSRAGARGLMQVMPLTGRMLARQAHVRNFSVDDLWNPRTSIHFGAQHLSDHLRYFDKTEDRRLGLALSAYNAGLNAARRWSKRLPDDDVDTFVESIPYRETRNYVKLVYRNYQVYSYLEGVGPDQEAVQ